MSEFKHCFTGLLCAYCTAALPQALQQTAGLGSMLAWLTSVDNAACCANTTGQMVAAGAQCSGHVGKEGHGGLPLWSRDQQHRVQHLP